MSDDGKLRDEPQTCVRVSISIAPVEHATGDLAGLLGNFVFDLVQTFGLSRQTSSSANIRMIDAISNVLEHEEPPEGELNVAFSMVDNEVAIEVRPESKKKPSGSSG